MSDRFKFYNYTLTTDPHLLEKGNQVPPELEWKIEKFFSKARKGGKSNINYIKKAIERFPNSPHLKNYLAVAYMNTEMEEESYKVNDRLIEEHPQYLFGILNKANEYLNKGEHEKMPGLMGENMELKDLYPEREMFHVTEMISFLETAIHYFIADNNFEATKSRVELLKELDPQNPLVLSFESTLSILGIGDEGMPFGKDKYFPKPEFRTYDKSVQTEQAPTFQNEIINKLYEAGFDIDQGIFEEILVLPRESAIQDLKKVLHDSVSRYDYFGKQVDKGNVGEAKLSFPIHATFLLGEMKASEAVEDVLECLRQGEDFLNFWYHDVLFEVYWQPLYKILPENQDTLKKFMFEPGIYTTAKSVISQTYLQYYLHNPEKREEIVAWYKEVLNTYLTTGNKNLVDGELIAFMVCEVLDAKFDELLPLIEQLYDADYVEEYIAGTKEEVLNDFGKVPPVSPKQPLLSIFEQYDEILNDWHFDEEDEEDEELLFEDWDADNWDESDEDLDDMLLQNLVEAKDNQNDIDHSDQAPIRRVPKIGRNEPCPCGSGKKYKKCCGKNG